jgi:hypothetical protein
LLSRYAALEVSPFGRPCSWWEIQSLLCQIMPCECDIKQVAEWNTGAPHVKFDSTWHAKQASSKQQASSPGPCMQGYACTHSCVHPL